MKTKKAQQRDIAKPLFCMARPARFERATAWFVARYSIQLSYGRVGGAFYGIQSPSQWHSGWICRLSAQFFHFTLIGVLKMIFKPDLPICPPNQTTNLEPCEMAEKEGFEPSIRDKPYTPLAGERLQPLGHLS